jgi:polar amino acid transport system substrate-binding protein
LWRRGLLIGAILLISLATGLMLRGTSPNRLLTRLFVRQDSTWADMQARGTWRVGMDPSFPPFEELDAQGVPVGFDVDLVEAMAAQWGLEAEIVPVGFDSLVDALRAGRIDSVVSALPYDPRATRDVTFSPPYFEAGLMLAVRAGAPISNVAQLEGRRVAVEWGSMGDMIGRRLEREGIGLTLVPYATPDEAVDALVNDLSIDALLIDQISLRTAQGRGAAVVAVGAPLEGNPYVIASPLRAYDLEEQIVRTLAQLQADGVLAALEASWFGPLPAPLGP